MQKFSATLTSNLAVGVGSLLIISFLTGCQHDPAAEKLKYLESGRKFEATGHLQEASIQLLNAIKVDHGYSDAHYELSKVYLKMGKVPAAYQELAGTVDLSPSNIQARIDLGEVLVAAGLLDRAKEQAKAIHALDARNAGGYALSATIADHAGDHELALSEMKQALNLDPKNANLHTALAVIENKTPGSGPLPFQQELQQAVLLNSKDSLAPMLLAESLEATGDRAGAEQQELAAIHNDPTNLRARADLARLYVREGRPEKAEASLRLTADQLPDDDKGARLLESFYTHLGQLDRAESAYAALSTAHPKSIPLRISYARICLAKGDYAKAQGITDGLAKTNADRPEVVALRATLLTHSGKVAEALTLLQNASQKEPDNVDLHLLLAQAAQIKNDANLSEKNYRSAAGLEPTNAQAQSGLADLAMSRGDWNDLISIADRMIALQPALETGYLWRATAEANKKQEGPAESDFKTALHLNPESASALLGLGQLKLQQKQIPAGTALLEESLRKDPNKLQALHLIVAFDLIARRPAEAVSRVREQIERSPANATLYTDLASLQLGLNNYSGALTASQKAMQLDPSNEDAVQACAKAQDSMGQVDQAINTWQTWLTAHPQDPKATGLLGTLQEEKGNWAQAMELYKKTLQLDPGQALASNNLAFLMVENGGNVDVALTLAQSALHSLPNSSSAADTLAWVYYHKGTYLWARDLLETAEKNAPNNAAVQYHLGMTYTKMNNPGEAKLHLKRAEILAPNTKISKDSAAALVLIG